MSKKSPAQTLSSQKPPANTILRLVRRDFSLILLALPGFLILLLFHYYPMVGILTAFQDTQPGSGFIFNVEWVGFKWFIEFFNSHYFWRLIGNTFLISMLTILFTFPMPIIFALLLHEIREGKYKKTVQSFSYLPHFISTVVIVGIMFSLGGSGGILSNMVSAIVGKPVMLMGTSEYYRAMYVGSEVWATFGWDSIVYIAALSAVNMELYEAAMIDGAGRWRRMLHITLPTLIPVMVIQFILRIGNILSIGAEKTILMYSPAIYDVSDIINSYVVRRGILEQNFSFGSAVSLFNSLVGLVFVVTTNKVSKKVYDISLW